ncbi:D-aminoacylase [Patescibacteria group bacterium]|nr:D-aminoacylase [Patescibacteria group bacterium]
MPTYSLLIRNGLVFDGTGSRPERTDIGIEGDVVSALGDLSKDGALTTIDANNLYVTPGFIDLTNHSDTHWTLFDLPRQDSLITQGVTTIVGGNCGSSLAPLVNARDIEGIQKWIDISRININWQKMEEFFAELEKHTLTLNVATLVGHGTLRRAVGMDITKPASRENINQMIFLLRSSFEAGALGLSFSLGRSHALSVVEEELRELFNLVKEFDVISTHHLQDEGREIVSSLSRIVSLARTTGARNHISHFKVLGKKSWPLQKKVLEMIENARNQGVGLTVDVFPYDRTGSNLYLLLPNWAREGGKRAILERLNDSEKRMQITEAFKTLTLHYDKIIVASTLHDTGAVGRSILQLSENSGLTPEDTMIELLLTNDLQVSIFNETISYDNVIEVLGKMYSAISSDGVGQGIQESATDLPHPRSFGTYPRIFNWMVKEREVLSWENAIHKMTGLPAEILGLEKRGVIKKGAFADVVIFDPERIRDTADYQTPRRFSEGIEWVFVNGTAVISAGEFTNQSPGRVVKKA